MKTKTTGIIKQDTTGAVMAKLRRQMQKVRTILRKQERLQKQMEREAYEWCTLGL